MADPVYFYMPESRDTYTLDEFFGTVATIPRASADYLVVTCCPSRTDPESRTWIDPDERADIELAIWIASDHVSGEFSILSEVDAVTGTPLRTLFCQVAGPSILSPPEPTPPNGLLIAERRGRKSLWDLGCGKLLTVNRVTHQVVRLVCPSEAATGIAYIDKTYSLTIDPLDCLLVDNDENLLYVDGNSLKLWSLKRDVFVRTVMTFDFAIAWPCALKDGTLLLAKSGDPFLDDFDIIRVTTAGRIVKPYPYDHDTFEEGLYGFVGVLTGIPCDPRGSGAIHIVGDWDKGDADEQGAALSINLRNGGQSITTPFPLPATDYDEDIASAFGLLEIVSLSIGAGSPTPRPRPNRVCNSVARVSTVQPTAGCNPGGLGWIHPMEHL